MMRNVIRLHHRRWPPICIAVVSGVLSGCQTPPEYRGEADAAAYALIGATQQESLGRTQPFSIDAPADTLRRRLLLDQRLAVASPASLGSGDMELIEQWPDPTYFDRRAAQAPLVDTAEGDAVKLSLHEALQTAARHSREYQRQKELVYQAALALDLEADAFRLTWVGVLDTLFSSDMTSGEAVSGVEHTDSVSLSKKFETGAQFTGLVAVDLVKLLTQDNASTLGLTAETTISIPLLRGSGRFVTREPLTQAQRDVVYAVYTFERFKRTFAVHVASDYLAVVQQVDQIDNAADNYRRVAISTRRAQAMAQTGRLSEIQVDQARQDELRARNRWITAAQNYEQRLDNFKILLGLPTDCRLELDGEELARLLKSPRYARYVTSELGDGAVGEVPAADAPVELIPPSREDAGPLEVPESEAIDLALRHRLDLRTAIGRIIDEQRGVAIAADNLRADLTLLGSASIGESRSLGSADRPGAQLRPNRGRYEALLGLDLPLERTAERNEYRNQLIALEQAVRAMQDAEDQAKLDVRNGLRSLLESRETLRIQAESVAVAQRRVDSTNLFMQAGEGEIRDVLEAEEALVSAKNALTAALVSYRVAELQLQRDMGLLEVNEQGLWREFNPEEYEHGNNADTTQESG